jgi:hypothetical protein
MRFGAAGGRPGRQSNTSQQRAWPAWPETSLKSLVGMAIFIMDPGFMEAPSTRIVSFATFGADSQDKGQKHASLQHA